MFKIDLASASCFRLDASDESDTNNTIRHDLKKNNSIPFFMNLFKWIYKLLLALV